ncbi:zona pellucida sperm-binding protein 4-like [Astyanax mexicanus]|uniref:zona pellucida sperm-binding protein 4-like n=1 Tax=Astyanax mexicanus TaxID=7994 RepID=UPI0020CAFF37|nr:zona pellucida sperm-binding protein 4-like [Astyanax mexicanus]
MWGSIVFVVLWLNSVSNAAVARWSPRALSEEQPQTPQFSGLPSGSLVPQLSGPLLFQPSWQLPSQPSGPLAPQPSGPLFSQPSGPLFSQPSGPLFSQPSGPLFSQPSGPLFSQPSGLLPPGSDPQVQVTTADKCNLDDSDKIPCGEPGLDASHCGAINCCFDGQQCYYGKTVTVQCTVDGQFVLVVARNTTLPRISLDSISLLGGSDGPCAVVDYNADFAIYQFPVTACGTNAMVGAKLVSR